MDEQVEAGQGALEPEVSEAIGPGLQAMMRIRIHI